MQKYNIVSKLSQSPQCTIYRAQKIDTQTKVTIKKLHLVTAWQQVFNSKEISIMKKVNSKYLSKISEIIKQGKSFYVVMDEVGMGLSSVFKQDIQKQLVFKIGKLLVEMAKDLQENQVFVSQIKPEHIFIDSKLSIAKLTHFELYKSHQQNQQQIYQYYSPTNFTSQIPDSSSMIFSMGMILCQMVVGEKLVQENNKQQYLKKLHQVLGETQQQSKQGGDQEIQKEKGSLEQILAKFNFSSEFVGLLKHMTKINEKQRLSITQLDQLWQTVIQKQKIYSKTQQSNSNLRNNKPENSKQTFSSPILNFSFEQKPTLTTVTILQKASPTLPAQLNITDDVCMPIVKDKKLIPIKIGKIVKVSHLGAVKKPQLTNYAKNNARLGVQAKGNESGMGE